MMNAIKLIAAAVVFATCVAQAQSPLLPEVQTKEKQVKAATLPEINGVTPYMSEQALKKLYPSTECENDNENDLSNANSRACIIKNFTFTGHKSLFAAVLLDNKIIMYAIKSDNLHKDDILRFITSKFGKPSKVITDLNSWNLDNGVTLRTATLPAVFYVQILTPEFDAVEKQIADKKREASKALAASWQYETKTDKMTDEHTRVAMLRSINSLSLSSPYNGENHGTIYVRQHPQHGQSVIVGVDKGQILCHRTCQLLFRIDGEKSVPISFTPSGSGNNDLVFSSNATTLIPKLAKAKKVLIQVHMWREGNQILEFEADEPLKWDAPAPASKKASGARPS